MQTPTTVIEAFKRALRRNRLEEAKALLPRLPAAVPREVAESVGLLHLMESRWQQAAQALGKLDGLSQELAAFLKLAKNMATLREYRPAVYSALMKLPESEAYQIQTTPPARPTLLCHGAPIGAEPSEAIQEKAVAAMQRLEDASDRPASVLLMGLGDGHTLNALFERPPNNPMGATATLHLIEPDLQLLKANLLLHDWSGPQGVLADPRVVMAVGEDWDGGWAQTLGQTPGLPLPTQVLPIGRAQPDLRQRAELVLAGVQQRSSELMQRLEAYYRQKTDRQIAVAMSFGEDRRPRALWLTSRFSKVVRYSAADAVHGLEAIGIDAEVLIERADHHQITARFLLEALDRVRPEVLMTINYLRAQFQNGLPKSLPVFSWLQDEVGELMSAEAGPRIDARQFVGACSPGLYVEQFGYPARQMMYLDKLTRFPASSTASGSSTPAQTDPIVVFVSNAARTPERLMDDLLARCQQGAARAVMAAGCRWLFAHYQAGGTCTVAKQLLPVVDDAVKAEGLTPLDEPERQRMAMLLFNAVNNTLYRQQALRWARAAAEAVGLELQLYGQDWDHNPEFKAHARGYAAYGPELEALTRRARFNLQIVPFNCVHQRLLDGWAAGGFFLVRDHPSDRMNRLWQGLFNTRPSQATDTAAWRAALPEAERAAFDEALALREAVMLDAGTEVLAASRAVCVDGFVPGASLPPCLGEVSFEDEASLVQRMRFFMADPDAQQRVLKAQRAALKLRGLQYSDGMRRVWDKLVREMAV